jgi:hypothetical protein
MLGRIQKFGSYFDNRPSKDKSHLRKAIRYAPICYSVHINIVVWKPMPFTAALMYEAIYIGKIRACSTMDSCPSLSLGTIGVG